MNPKLRNDSSVNVKNGDVTAEQGSNVNYAPSTTIFQNKKVVIGSVVAVVALLIIGFIIFRGSSLDSQLVGTWSCVDHSAQRQTFVFKSKELCRIYSVIFCLEIPFDGVFQNLKCINYLCTIP